MGKIIVAQKKKWRNLKMSVDTDGKIKAKYGVKDIQRIMKHKLHIDSILRYSGMKDFYTLEFNYKDEHRILSVFENYVDDETNETGTHLSMGMYGSSIQIMRGILEGFGGYIRENDLHDHWEYVAPSEKVHLTDHEILEDQLYGRMKQSDLNFVEKQHVIGFIKENLEFIKSL